MAGCYRCGMSEGSETRLCETCFRMRYHRGRDVIDLPAGTPLEGLEFSPKVRTALLSSGAMLYMSFVGLFVVMHYQYNARTHGDERIEYFAAGDRHSEFASTPHFNAVRVAGRFASMPRLREAVTESESEK